MVGYTDYVNAKGTISADQYFYPDSYKNAIWITRTECGKYYNNYYTYIIDSTGQYSSYGTNRNHRLTNSYSVMISIKIAIGGEEN